MPREGATIFSDLIGKFDLLRLACGKCGRVGRYILARLIRQRGRDGKIVDRLDEITAGCPKNSAHNMNDRCGARCPDLPRVLYSFPMSALPPKADMCGAARDVRFGP
jgi:hypothetical protein